MNYFVGTLDDQKIVSDSPFLLQINSNEGSRLVPIATLDEAGAKLRSWNRAHDENNQAKLFVLQMENWVAVDEVLAMSKQR